MLAPFCDSVQAKPLTTLNLTTIIKLETFKCLNIFRHSCLLPSPKTSWNTMIVIFPLYPPSSPELGESGALPGSPPQHKIGFKYKLDITQGSNT